jgi:hypothetical protein
MQQSHRIPNICHAKAVTKLYMKEILDDLCVANL